MKKSLAFFGIFLIGNVALFADVEEAAPVRDGGIWQTLSMLAIFLLFFYFILYRPEQKRREAAEAMRSELKKGDKVTAVGIVGIVEKIQDETVILKMVDGSKIEVVKGAISEVASGSDASTKKDTAEGQ